MRRILCGIACVGLLAALAPSAAAASADTGPLVQVSGPSPFADCPPADLDEVLPKGEVEPNVAVNPTNPANVVGVWMQDRFRGLVAGVSLDVAVIGSTNQGRSWSGATVVDQLQTVGTTDPQTGDPVAGGNLLTDLAVDPASGRLYLVWQDARFNDGRADGIALSSSADGGSTWTTPVKVNATPTGIPIGNQPASPRPDDLRCHDARRLADARSAATKSGSKERSAASRKHTATDKDPQPGKKEPRDANTLTHSHRPRLGPDGLRPAGIRRRGRAPEIYGTHRASQFHLHRGMHRNDGVGPCK